MAASIIDITGGSLSNATVGVPSTQAQEADYNLVAKKINSEGGAGCRKIVMRFYDVNPVNAADAQQSCLNIAQRSLTSCSTAERSPSRGQTVSPSTMFCSPRPI